MSICSYFKNYKDRHVKGGFYNYLFDVFFLLPRACPASFFDTLLVLPSRRTSEAILATFRDVLTEFVLAINFLLYSDLYLII